MANDKFPLIVNASDVTGTALSKVVQLQPVDKLSPDALPVMVGDTGLGGTAGIVPAPAAGDAAAGKYLDADGTWTIPAGGGGGSGDVTGPATSTAGNIPKWQDTTGEVLSDGVAAPTGAIVGTSDAQTLTNKTLTAPILTTPTLGVATATSVNKVAVTAPATSATLTIADGATLTASATASVAGTNSGDVSLAGTPDYITISGQTITRGAVDLGADVTGTLPIGGGGTGQATQTAAMDALSPTTTKGDILADNGTNVVRLPVGLTNGFVLTVDSLEATGLKYAAVSGGGDAVTSGTLAQFAATTSAQLAGVLSDETGSGAAVFATSPTLVTPALGTPSAAVLTNATGLPTAGLVDGAVTYAKIQDVSVTDRLLGRSTVGAGDVEEIACTAAGRALLDDATAAAQRTTLGLGTLAVESTAPIAQGGTGQTTQTAGFDALSPTTTKGDLIADNGTSAVRLAVGATTGHVLTVDPLEATGLKYAATGDATTAGTLAQFAPTTSAQLAGVLSDETGTGAAVFATSPVLVTPNLGTPSAATLTNALGLPTGGVTVSATDRLLGRVSALGGVAEEIPITDFVQTILDDADAAAVRATIGAGTGNGDALTSGHLGQFAATTSAQLAGVISDETGTGVLVLATSPTLVTPVLGVATATSVNKVVVTAPATSATLTIADGATLTASATATVSGTNSGDQTVTLTADVTGSGTGSFAATIANDAVTNAKAANMAEATIKGRAAGAGTGDPTDLTAAQVVTLTGAEVTANKGIASGYASLDTLAQVPIAQQRPLGREKIHYQFRKIPSVPAIDLHGANYDYMADGAMSDSPGNGGSWAAVNTGTGGNGGLITPFDVVQTRWGPEIHFEFKTPTSLVGARLWIGLSASFIDDTAPIEDGDVSITNGTFSIASAAFCWDATVHAGSNFWRAHTSGGAGANDGTVTVTTQSIAANTIYGARIVCNAATNVLFYINDVLVATHTTDLPSVSTPMGIGLRVVGTSLAFEWQRIDVIHD